MIFDKIKKKYKEIRISHCTGGEKKRAQLLKKYIGLNIGENCEVYKNVYFGSEPYLIQIGNHVRITSGVKFCTHDGGMWVIRGMEKNPDADYFGQIIIDDNVHIGWNAIIMPGVHIGKNCIIGTAAVVTHDIPDNSIAAGVPARVISSIDQYYERKQSFIVNTKHMSATEKKQYLEEQFKEIKTV